MSTPFTKQQNSKPIYKSKACADNKMKLMSVQKRNFVFWRIENFEAKGEINVSPKKKFVFWTIENFEGKGENASDQHFLLFPQCFQKASFSGSLNVGIVW